MVEKRQKTKAAAMSKPSSHPKPRQSQKQKVSPSQLHGLCWQLCVGAMLTALVCLQMFKQAEIAEESEVAFPLDGYMSGEFQSSIGLFH